MHYMPAPLFLFFNRVYAKRRPFQAWSLESYALVLSVKAHRESVLGLFLSQDGTLLFSSGGDSVVNVSKFRNACGLANAAS